MRLVLLALTLVIPVSAANIVLNGSFESVGASVSYAINYPYNLPNWTLSAVPSGNKILNCLIAPGDTTNLCGSVAFGGGLSFWVNPGPSPDGGHFVAIDGDQAYSLALQQTLTGLTIGAHYTLNFWQASAQQSNRDGATTERWSVTFGSQNQLSTLMSTPNHGSIGWMQQTMSFTATATTQVLSFLAVGTPAGLPPFVLLDGVSMTQNPEPGTFVMLGLGGIVIFLGRRKKTNRS